MTFSKRISPAPMSIGPAPGRSSTSSGWRCSETSSSMSLIERCRLRMFMPTSRR
ncbi:Uncharacterised protein [Bordetella pertussis]|nr:Uncharacterised protein [Bordetella pertussis]